MARRVFSQKASRHLSQLQNLSSRNDFQKKNGGAQISFFEAFDKKLSGWNDFPQKSSLALEGNMGPLGYSGGRGCGQWENRRVGMQRSKPACTGSGKHPTTLIEAEGCKQAWSGADGVDASAVGRLGKGECVNFGSLSA